MTTFEIWIPGRLPGENEIIKAAKSGRGKYNAYGRLKEKWEKYVSDIIKECELEPVKSIFVKIEWVESDRRRDPDNIAAGKKFVFDGMVRAGLIQNDGWKQIEGWTEIFLVNPKNYGVNLIIQTKG